LKVLTAFKGSYFYILCALPLGAIVQCQPNASCQEIESKALGEAFVGDGSASQLAKASTT
jgi:hypothetical protein